MQGALNGLGLAAHAEGDYERALAYVRQGLEQAERTPSLPARAAALCNLGGVLRCLGRMDEAAEKLQAALAASREARDMRTEADALNGLAMLAGRMGDLEGGRRWARQSLAVCTTMRFGEGQLDALETLASIEAAGGKAFEALQVLTVVDRERPRLGGAALNVERRQLWEAALAAARSGLSEEERAAAVAGARLVSREDLVDGTASSGR